MNLGMLANAVRLMVTRGRVAAATLGPRTLLQLTRYKGETFNGVELLLPPGYCALPLPGATVLVAYVGGLADHKVALGGDNVADRQADLQPGEFGLSSNGQRIILRQNKIEITTTKPVKVTGSTVTVVAASKIVLQAPTLYWSPDGSTMHKLATDQHVHGNVSAGGAQTSAPVNGLT